MLHTHMHFKDNFVILFWIAFITTHTQQPYNTLLDKHKICMPRVRNIVLFQWIQSSVNLKRWNWLQWKSLLFINPIEIDSDTPVYTNSYRIFSYPTHIYYFSCYFVNVKKYIHFWCAPFCVAAISDEFFHFSDFSIYLHYVQYPFCC